MEQNHLPDQSAKNTDAATLIYTALRKEILDMTIKPGEQIIESAVCSRFKTSRTPVREAFQRLQSAGLITTVPYKGSCATLLDYNAIQQVIFMRGAVESVVISDFIHDVSPYQIEELRYRLNLQRILLENEFDTVKFYNADSTFHSVWFKHQKKELVWKIIQKSQQQYSRFKMLDLKSRDACRNIFDEHTHLFELIENRDAAAAAAFIKEHLNGGIIRVGERITKDYADYFVP